jgi:hypothetical protein
MTAALLALLIQDPEAALKAEIEALKPPKLAWQEIDWKVCPLQALKESRDRKAPILVWVFLGHPSDERC